MRKTYTENSFDGQGLVKPLANKMKQKYLSNTCGIYNSIPQLVITAASTLLSHCIIMQSLFGKLFKLWEIWPSSSKKYHLTPIATLSASQLHVLAASSSVCYSLKTFHYITGLSSSMPYAAILWSAGDVRTHTKSRFSTPHLIISFCLFVLDCN